MFMFMPNIVIQYYCCCRPLSSWNPRTAQPARSPSYEKCDYSNKLSTNLQPSFEIKRRVSNNEEFWWTRSWLFLDLHATHACYPSLEQFPRRMWREQRIFVPANFEEEISSSTWQPTIACFFHLLPHHGS